MKQRNEKFNKMHYIVKNTCISLIPQEKEKKVKELKGGRYERTTPFNLLLYVGWLVMFLSLHPIATDGDGMMQNRKEAANTVENKFPLHTQ